MIPLHPVAPLTEMVHYFCFCIGYTGDKPNCSSNAPWDTLHHTGNAQMQTDGGGERCEIGIVGRGNPLMVPRPAALQ